MHDADAWLGVESGGGMVLRRMQQLNALRGRCEFVRAARPGTKRRSSRSFQAILNRLPRSVADVARVAEHLIREWRFETNRRIEARDVRLSDGAVSLVACSRSVILVDDAVDSGSSIVQLIEAVSQVNPNCRVIVASITQTFSNPLRQPDVFLVKGQLLRFPWSADAGR